MALLNKFKNFLRSAPVEKKLPSYVQENVNPKDHWTTIKEIGDGAFGKVEKVVSKSDPSLVAASKCIVVEEGEKLEDLLVEIEILTEGKEHPVMLGLYTCYVHDDKLTMLLEFCGGGALDNIMLELEKAMTEPQIRYVAYYVCDALQWLHSKGIMHRDLKAGNILLTDDGQVRLADFGVSAKMNNERGKRDSFIGTPYWMAPEVMMCETFKDQPYDSKCDIWSFGITLIEMAQKEPPHSEFSPLRVLLKVQKSPPPTLDSPGNWSKFFHEFLRKCLVKAPQMRESAETLMQHEWLRNAQVERKHIRMLLAEMNADVREEIIIDGDEESMAGSDENSQRPTGQDSWSSASESPLPPVATSTENYKQNYLPPNIHTPPPDTPQKKRAAPPPPQEVSITEEKPNGNIRNVVQKSDETSYVEISFMSPSPKPSHAEVTNRVSNNTSAEFATPHSLTLNTSSSLSPMSYHKNDSQFTSPRREALDILDDLTSALDGEQGSTSPSASYNEYNSDYPPEPRSPHSKQSSPTRSNELPNPIEHSIRDVIHANREKKSPSPSLPVSPITTSSSSDSIHGSIHKADSYQSITATVPHRETEKISFNASKPSAFDNIRNRIESADENQNRTSSRNSPQPDIPDGIVKEKKMQVERDSGNSSKSSSEKQESNTDLKRSMQSLSATHVVQERLRDMASLSVSAPSTPARSAERYSPARNDSYSSVKSNQPPSLSSTPVPTNPEYFDVPYNKKKDEKTVPPPEPPVDYDGMAKENNRPSSANLVKPPASPAVVKKTSSGSSENKPKPLGGRRDASRQTVTKKTRTYMIDGVQMTSTTVHVLGVKDDKVQRKQQLHDLRRLQRDETRQKQELQAEGFKLVEEQTKKFGSEQQNLSRTSELEMDAMERRQRKEIEDAESAQDTEMRMSQKRLKIEQEKDMRAFKERLKQEMKIFKQELNMLSKVQRKDALKQRKDQIELEHQLKEKDFMMQLTQNGDSMLQRMSDKHKERMAATEKQFLMQKHNLLRAKENNIWELEDKQMREKFVLHRKLFKDEYYLLRTQMLSRHQREIAQIEKMHQEEEDELIRALTVDRKKLPKMLRAETKTRSVMFKESLRISMANMSNAEMQERIRRFDEQEALRMRTALEEHDFKSQKKLQILKERQQEAIMELNEMQNEKRKQLLEKERNTMNEHEAKYHEMRNLWQENLIPRKTVLEEKFQDELSKQEVFYGVPYTASQASTISGRHMP